MNRVSIYERPPEADGTHFGDWEMNFIVDREQDAILTLVERSSDRFLMACLPYKEERLKTITTDNDPEFAAHEWLAKKLDVPVYFTGSYPSWQKGNIRNTNKLIRQYIPKGTDISTVTDRKIAAIQAKINRRPREKLKFSTPNEVFFKQYM